MHLQQFFYHLKRGKLTIIGKPIFHSLVSIELTLFRWLNGKPGKNTPLVNTHLTAVIKTFERPTTLKRLLKSIRRFYPELRIIVVDDSKIPVELDDTLVIQMPYDTGISAGRNQALKEVTTEYILLLDDDFIFYDRTDLEPAMEAMMNQPKIDIMGGQVINLPLLNSAD
jgi:GT2 family glycosyltransferase